MKIGKRDDEKYVRRQYETQDNLNVRIRTHQLYGEPRLDFAEWVMERINWQGNEQVVDVGCGSGIYTKPALARAGHYVAADLSLGMLQKLEQPHLDRVALNAQALAMAANSADVILANHMLYHVPDQDAALTEFVRVLRPHGLLVAATNSGSNMSEFETFIKRAFKSLGIGEPEDAQPVLSFTLETGRQLLERHFAYVERYDLPGALVFPDPEPVIAYLASSRERFETRLPPGYSWENVVVALDQILAADIAENGQFRVSKLTGVFICHN